VGVVLNYSESRTSDPATSPIKLKDIKSELSVFHNERDGDLQSMLDAAVDRVETDTRRALITQTWAWVYDEWPEFPWSLPRRPVQSIVVTYLDTDDNSQTYAAGNYTLSTARAAVFLKQASTLPALSDEVENVTFTAVCGFGTTPADIPERYRQAITLLVKEMYDGCPIPTIMVNGHEVSMYDVLVGQLSWGSYP
jgi:uncharacterized phiE125 gp8 family phage protein